MDLDKLKTTAGLDVRGKRVLVRADLNVPVKDGKVSDATRLERLIPGLQDLARRGAKVIVISHFGRPKGGPDPQFSLKPVAAKLAELMGKPVAFAGDCIGEPAAKVVSALRDGDVAVLENLRFHKGEEKNDPEFARALAEPRRHLRRRCLLHGASRARLDGCDRAAAAVLCRAAPHGGGRRAGDRAGETGAPGRGRDRRRQGVEQDRRAHQPRRQGRQADHRRRHGQHLLPRRGCGDRQVAGGARSHQDGARDHARGQGAPLRGHPAARFRGRAQARGRCSVARRGHAGDALGPDDPRCRTEDDRALRRRP